MQKPQSDQLLNSKLTSLLLATPDMLDYDNLAAPVLEGYSQNRHLEERWSGGTNQLA